MTYYKNLNINGEAYPIAVNITGVGTPTDTTEAEVGMLYMDTDNGDVYKKTPNGWEKVGGATELAEVGKRIAGGFMPRGEELYDVSDAGEPTITLEVKAATSIDDPLYDSVRLNFPPNNDLDLYVRHIGGEPVQIRFTVGNNSVTDDCTVLFSGPPRSVRELFGIDYFFDTSNVYVSMDVLNRGDACALEISCARIVEGKDGLMSSEDKAKLESLAKEVGNVSSALKETATKNDVEALDTKLTANILKGSASGTIVAMKDVSPIEHEMGVKVRWKNKFYLNETKTRTAGGLSFNLTQGQSSFIINGTSTASSSAKITEMPLKAGTYSIAIYGANVISTDMDRIYLQYTDTSGKNVYVNNIVNDKPKTFTLPYDITARVDFVFAANSTYENKTICIQIEEGTTATAYAPYIPDISAVKLKAYEQNLLNIDAGVNGKSFVKNSDGTYTLAKQDGNRLTGKIPFDYPNTSFSLYVEIVDTNIDGLNGISTMFKNAEETKTQYPRMTPDGKCTLIDTGGRSGLIQLYIDNAMSNGSYITFKNPQIAVSSTPITEYKPYVEPIEYSVSTEGASKVTSLHPTTTICADTDGVLIDCTYNRDINIAFKNLEEKITALSAALI